jgi:hypothetical protein
MTKKLMVLIVLTLLIFMLSGCVNPLEEKQALEEMNLLQQKYLVKENFSTNQKIMNDYINELSLLKSKSASGQGKIVEAELYSAQTFYYLNKALIISSSINYQKFSCSTKEVKEAISSINLADEYQTKAISLIQTLSETQQENLRPNQIDIIQNYRQTILQIKSFFEEKC